MADLQSEIRRALSTFLKTDDDTELERLVSNHPEIIEEPTGEFPDLHRLLDVVVGDEFFRVSRQISKGERIYLEPLHEGLFDERIGVPLWVTGEALERWAAEEENDPRKEKDRDWQRFFRPEPESESESE